MAAPHQDLWSPDGGRGWGGKGKDTIYWIFSPEAEEAQRTDTNNSLFFVAYMYSMVPQKVCVTVPSWMDSLQRPKSVNFTCPTEGDMGTGTDH